MDNKQQRLIDKKLRKTLSEREELEFNSLYSADLDFKIRYKEELEIAESIVYLSRKELYSELEQMNNSNSKIPFNISWKKGLTIAASLFFIVGLIWFLNPTETRDDSILVQKANKDSLKIALEITKNSKDIQGTKIQDYADSINKDKTDNRIARTTEEPMEIEKPTLVKRELSITVSKAKEGFGYNSNKEEKKQFNIEYDETAIQYKFSKQRLEFKGKVDTNAIFKMEVIKSLDGNNYKLFMNEKSYSLDETESFILLRD